MYNVGRNRMQGRQNIPMPKYLSFTGIITNILNKNNNGCTQVYQLENSEGNITNFNITPQTYFVNHKKAALGMPMTAFYDANLPAILIYPPEFTAVAASLSPDKNIKIDRFNQNLVSQDGTLKLNLSPRTEILLENGQTFHGDIRNRDLIVVYGASTRSIPAQTTPEQIIVICQSSM